VGSAADLVACGTQKPQHSTDDGEDQTDRPQQRDAGQQTDEEEHDSEDEHGVMSFLAALTSAGYSPPYPDTRDGNPRTTTSGHAHIGRKVKGHPLSVRHAVQPFGVHQHSVTPAEQCTPSQ
jgi:hypothetical protein